MKSDFFDEERYNVAQKRVKEIKGFYWHLFWYLAVNIFITFGSVFSEFIHVGTIDMGNFNFGMFSVWFFWGIGLVAHWIRVFGKNIFFSKDWEERKIKEFMDKNHFD